MKVPDKIYGVATEGGFYLYTFKPEPPSVEGVEYTRTDSFMEKSKEWFIEHVNIPQNVATNEDGEPLADSYIKYAKARFDAANEMFEHFKNYLLGE